MDCPQCDTENPEGARFCLGCGARFPLACPQCSTELPPEARFCFACGAEVSVAPVLPPVPPARHAVERLRRLRTHLGYPLSMQESLIFIDVTEQAATEHQDQRRE